jgi:hypothetical protein
MEHETGTGPYPEPANPISTVDDAAEVLHVARFQSLLLGLFRMRWA